MPPKYFIEKLSRTGSLLQIPNSQNCLSNRGVDYLMASLLNNLPNTILITASAKQLIINNVKSMYVSSKTERVYFDFDTFLRNNYTNCDIVIEINDTQYFSDDSKLVLYKMGVYELFKVANEIDKIIYYRILLPVIINNNLVLFDDKGVINNDSVPDNLTLFGKTLMQTTVYKNKYDISTLFKNDTKK